MYFSEQWGSLPGQDGKGYVFIPGNGIYTRKIDHAFILPVKVERHLELFGSGMGFVKAVNGDYTTPGQRTVLIIIRFEQFFSARVKSGTVLDGLLIIVLCILPELI